MSRGRCGEAGLNRQRSRSQQHSQVRGNGTDGISPKKRKPAPYSPWRRGALEPERVCHRRTDVSWDHATRSDPRETRAPYPRERGIRRLSTSRPNLPNLRKTPNGVGRNTPTRAPKPMAEATSTENASRRTRPPESARGNLLRTETPPAHEFPRGCPRPGRFTAARPTVALAPPTHLQRGGGSRPRNRCGKTDAHPTGRKDRSQPRPRRRHTCGRQWGDFRAACLPRARVHRGRHVFRLRILPPRFRGLLIRLRPSRARTPSNGKRRRQPGTASGRERGSEQRPRNKLVRCIQPRRVLAALRQ